jgi:hypothetical protein
MGINYSVFKLPIATNAIEVNRFGLKNCITKQNTVAGTSAAQENKNNIINCIIDNVRVRSSPTSSEYLPMTYLGPVPQIDKDGNILSKLDYALPELSNCLKALDNAQNEPFDTEARDLAAKIEAELFNKKTNEIAMPIIVLIIICLIIYLLKK